MQWSEIESEPEPNEMQIGLSKRNYIESGYSNEVLKQTKTDIKVSEILVEIHDSKIL